MLGINLFLWTIKFTKTVDEDIDNALPLRNPLIRRIWVIPHGTVVFKPYGANLYALIPSYKRRRCMWTHVQTRLRCMGVGRRGIGSLPYGSALASSL